MANYRLKFWGKNSEEQNATETVKATAPAKDLAAVTPSVDHADTRQDTGSTTTRRSWFRKATPDTQQLKVVYRQFGPNAENIVTVEPDEIPLPDSPHHVVLKVQVRQHFHSFIPFIPHFSVSCGTALGFHCDTRRLCHSPRL